MRRVFRSAGVNAVSETLRRFAACRRSRSNEGLHLNRHGGNLRRRPRDRNGSEQGRRSVPTGSTSDDPRGKRRDRGMHQGGRDGNLDHGLPVVRVTGDRALTAEAKALLPNVHTVAVKDATGATSAKNLHPKKAQEQIQSEATKAVRDAKTIAPLRARPQSRWSSSSVAR